MNDQTKKQTSTAMDTWNLPTEPVSLTPVGIVRSDIKAPALKADKDGLSREENSGKIEEDRRKVKEMISEIIIKPELADILDGIDAFSHILVLYWPHLVPPERRSLRKVHPMGRKEIPRQGIFATCSPARPNPILVTAVRLLERRNHILRVQGFEAVDGSPVLDIKPYNPGYYRIDQPTIPDWMSRVHRETEGEEAD